MVAFDVHCRTYYEIGSKPVANLMYILAGYRHPIRTSGIGWRNGRTEILE